MAHETTANRHQGRPARVPSLVHALIPVFTLIALLAAAYCLFSDLASQGPNQVALLFCGLVAAGIALLGLRMLRVSAPKPATVPDR